MRPGRVLAAYSRRYLVEDAAGGLVPCLAKGRRSEYACGDRVRWRSAGSDQGLIEALEARSTLFMRANRHRSKLIAANVTRVVVLVAAEPGFSADFVDRALVAARSQRVPAVVLCNKADLAEQTERAMARLAPYRAAGYAVVAISAKRDGAAVLPHIAGHVNLLLGQSGMGKSTLVNRLVPGAEATTREISRALDSGKHTTTHARLFHVDARTDLIDCPGMQEFGLAHLSFADLERGFAEFDALLGACRFANCRHAAEPGCAIRAAVESGRLDAARYASFRALAAELGAKAARPRKG